MIGIYFSGTGNTRYCVEQFLSCYHGSRKGKVFSIEDQNVIEELRKDRRIVLGYPVYFSNMPKIMKDFLVRNQAYFKNKEVFIIATMGMFSGDGTGCGARILKKYGAAVTGGLHLKMPDSIADEKVLKNTPEKNKQLVAGAGQKIKRAVLALKQGQAVKEGLGLPAHIAGLFGQRLWFYHKTRTYTDRLRIAPAQCSGCGKCLRLCPMGNLTMSDQTAVSGDRCTMCYRCINHCPAQAITLLGKKVAAQSLIDDYL